MPSNTLIEEAAMAGAAGADGKEWVERLAEDIREKNREAAQTYGRDQHYADVVARVGKEFFVRLTARLEEDIDSLRRKLQGDVASSEMAVQPLRAGEVRITRERFPWVDATVCHKDDSILVDYAKAAGVAGDPQLDRKTRAFVLRAAPLDDLVYAEDAFGDRPKRYNSPEELARSVMELLFGV
jgi:hypothetical protein